MLYPDQLIQRWPSHWRAAEKAVLAILVLIASATAYAGKSLFLRFIPSVSLPIVEDGREKEQEEEEEKKGTDVADHVGLARIVCEALLGVKGYGVWGRLQAEDVDVRDVSGHGGSKTFILDVQEVDGLSSKTVVMHVRPDDCGSFMMRRTEAAQAALWGAGLGPLRLASGSDWWVESYVGPERKKEEQRKKPKPKGKGVKGPPETEEEVKRREAEDEVKHRRKGALLRRVHEVDAGWFHSFREELRGRDARLKKTPDSSLLWLYLTRGCFGVAREADEAENWFSKKSTSSDKWTEETLNRYGDLTQFESRIPLLNSIVTLHGDYHCGNVLTHKDERDAEGPLLAGVTDFEFTSAGLAILDLAYGLPDQQKRADAFIRGYLEEARYGDAAAIDAALPLLREDCASARMTMWCEGFGMAGWEAQDVTGEDIESRLTMIHRGALDIRSGAKTKEEVKFSIKEAIVTSALPTCATHKREQEALEAEVQAAKESGVTRAGDGGVEKGPQTFFIQAAADATLVLAKAPGCKRVWLEEVSDPPNQDAMWILRSDGRVVHAATGLCLTTPVKYPFTERNMPWEDSLTALELAPEEVTGAAQLWCHEWSKGRGLIIRHVVDGRSVIPNFVEVAAGRGVNASVPDLISSGRRAHYWTLRACDSGECSDVCELPAAGEWQPRVDGGGGRTLAKPGAIITIRCEEENDFCLGVSETRVCCVQARKRDPGSVQWRVVGTDHLQHVESGLFLTTNTKYVHINDTDHIWEGNHTDLELKEKSAGDVWEQRWVLGHAMDPADMPSILRHYGDGRCVDVHGWHFSDGGNMGTEHSAHAECSGTRYKICCETSRVR